MAQRPLLIVDDEPLNLHSLRELLSDDYELAFATSGARALEVIKRVRPRLILLDVCMPEMNGYEVCASLKQNTETADIPVIFISSLSEDLDEARGFEAGAVDYITKPFSPEVVKARVRTHVSLVQASRLEKAAHDAIKMLGAAGHYNDNDTGVHIWRMAAYARALAEAVGWDHDECDNLEAAAPMHDTGKIGIPKSILCKPGPLNDEEWVVMRSHPQLGFDILSNSDSPIFKLAAEVALYHHEKWDGSGYPHGLSGEAIPLSARIVAVADVFDALTMKRPYKEAWSVGRAIDTIRQGAGSHFDPQLVRHFERILPKILRLRAQFGTPDEDLDDVPLVQALSA